MHGQDEQPIISWVCVTRRRSYHLAWATHCFQSQTKANQGLVIVHPVADELTKDFTALGHIPQADWCELHPDSGLADSLRS